MNLIQKADNHGNTIPNQILDPSIGWVLPQIIE